MMVRPAAWDWASAPYGLHKDEDHVAACDEHFTEEYEIFSNASDLREKYKIGGKPLIQRHMGARADRSCAIDGFKKTKSYAKYE